MKKKPNKSKSSWADPEDGAVWTQEQLERAELAVGEKVLRPAAGTLTRPRGRPKKENPKELVRIRLSPEVVRHFRASGKGWQTRIDEALKAMVTPPPT